MWADVLAVYVLDPAEMLLLHELCRTADELDVLQASLAVAEPVVEGSHGQPRPHPLLAEIREHRKVADRLALALALPNVGAGETVGSRRSPGARKAANARWGRRGA